MRTFALLLLAACNKPETASTAAPATASATASASASASAPATASASAAVTAPVSVAASATGPVVGTGCASDSDCVITTFGGCCNCPTTPTAMHRVDLKHREDMCAIVDCKTPANECPKVYSPTAYRAVCKAHVCTTVSK